MTLKVITTQSGTTCKLTSIPRTRHQSTVSESSKPAPFVLPLTTFSVLSLSSSSSGHRSARNGRVTAVRAMPTPSSAGSVCRFDDSTFLASLMPKKETGVDRFLEAHPEYDGRGVIVAIFDSGVDPAVAGLQVTSDGKPKILDIVDCTGSGDIDTSEIVKADADGQIIGKSGIPLIVNPSWKNPSGEWHIGCKLVYELFTNTLTERLKKEKRKKWDEKNQEAISDALRNLDAFIKMHGKPEDIILKKAKEDLQNKIDILRKQAENYDDRGPIIDVVVWNDGSLWRVAVDTQSLEDDSKSGMLADFVPLTNYRIERKYGVFSKLDACSFVTNVYNDGNLLSLVTDCSPHGTHVAGITAAFHPEEPLLNGVAPGAQLISCKIGDSRLGSMETGTGLVRALIVAVEHKCDLINMSYGEATLLPDYGRFVDLVNEVVDKHRLIFISSAGNNGPALSTVGSPGGTSSSIIGVGAYVSPAMAAGPHCTVEAPPEGLEYTWSSRGPTLDGDLGVCISAPGGAVSPVPTWTLQRRMLMNGTSMSSPSACGGVAIIISGMKAEGVSISPYVVRKALENTAISVGINPEDKLSIGQGLMQVDSAFEYLLQGRNLPCVCYKVSVNRSGKSSPLSRGIYLREPNSCKQSTEWTIQVDPKFHEDASNLEELVPFEEHIKLHSSDKSVIKVPEYLLLTHNGRSFNIVVDPSNLNMGLHYYEVYGVDCKAPWRGPLFRVPITLIKPDVPKGQPPLLSFSGISFVPGKIERKFIEVPDGATWAEATMKTSCFDTPRRFFLDAVQTCPLMRTMKWETVVTFTTPSLQCFSFPVRGGLTLELVLSQFWSSGLGSNEATFVDFEVVFHGININREELVFDGSEAPLRIDAKSLLCSETLFPVASLNKVKIPHRPVDSKLSSLLADRDKLPSGRQVISLTLTYKFKLDEGAEIKPCIPLLNNRVYDIKFESQFYMISDSDKRVYATGDAYPKYVKLPKGEYTLQLLIRHDNVTFLDKVKQLLVFIERKLDKKDIIQLPFFTQPDGPIVGNCAFKSSLLVPGELEAFYVGPPTKDKIPKNCPSGAILIGTISYGKLSLVSKKDEKNQQPPTQYKISYIIPPSMVNDTGKENSSNKMEISERLEEEVRAAKLKILATLKHATAEERESWKEFCSTLKSEYPRYTPLLAKILEGWVSGTVGDVTNNHKKEVVAAANDVIKSINKDELSNYFSTRHDPDDDEFESMKKEMELTRDQLVEALYQKGIALAEMQSPNVEIPTEGNIAERKVYEETIEGYIPVDSDQSDTFEETLKELKRWVDLKSSKFAMLLVKNEIRDGRLGTALKVLDDIIQDESNSSKKKLYELKIKLLKEIGWDHVASYERQWMHVRFPSILSSL